MPAERRGGRADPFGLRAMSTVTSSNPTQAAPSVAAPESNAVAARRHGGITLARHGEPALSRRVKLDAAGYRRWWAAYEAGGILPGQTPPAELLELARRADVIFASIRPRAVQTAEAVAAGRSFVREPLLIEAPLPPPPFPGWLRLSPRTWGFVARTAWWFFGHHQEQETRAAAETRAKAAVAQLTEAADAGREVLVVAHGFFNAMLARELKRQGWRQAAGGGAFTRYWQSRRFERD